MHLKNITVFCGANSGANPEFTLIARKVGSLLAGRGIGVVYGGAKIGIMGAVADGALARGGRVTGILPHFLSAREIAHDGLTELVVVDSMHERKLKMYAMSDGFLVLPGGFGTMDELFETLTWAQLGLHQKPIGILNIGHYYDELIALVERMAAEMILKDIYRSMMIVGDEIEELLSKMENYRAPQVEKWITPDKT